MSNQTDYKDQMFEQISQIIEDTGIGDDQYDNYKKAEDILDVLEALLAYAIYNTCVNPETIRDACEESYVNIKKRALAIFHKFGLEKEIEEATQTT